MDFEYMELLKELYDKHAVHHYEKVFPLPPKTSVRVKSCHNTEDGIKWGITCLKTITTYKKLASYRGVKFHAIRMISGWNHNPFLGTPCMITDCNAAGIEPMISPLYYKRR